MAVKLVSGGAEPPESEDEDFNLMVQDLYVSGLSPENMNARVIENSERAATSTSGGSKGYVIPYFSQDGRILPFYRVRLFDADLPYRHPKGSPNHVYFPKAFQQAFTASKGHSPSSYIILTDNEKRASRACELGFPAVAFSDAYAWKNRTSLIPGDAILSQQGNMLGIELQRKPTEEDSSVNANLDLPLAVGLIDLIDRAKKDRIHLVIIFENGSSSTSTPPGPSSLDQRSIFELACELRSRGISYNHIHQYILPQPTEGPTERTKIGLDDYLTLGDPRLTTKHFRTSIDQITSGQSRTFPKHPNIVDYINRRLQKSKLQRKEATSIAMAVLSDLDSHGIRLRAPTTEAFYFDYQERKLLKSAWATVQNTQTDSPFTQYLYNTYGLSAADHRIMVWLGIQFTAEQPIDPVTPHRVFARPDIWADTIYYQLSDSEFIEVTAGSVTVRNNGDKNILFEADQVEALSTPKLLEAFNAQSNRPLPDCWWASTLSQVRLRDKDKQRIVAALLYYMSPWLLRWRGMQLPVELITGESGSGKSTLCELRLDILTGRPLLRNTPTDLKDWHASVTNTGGLHVTDNAQLADRGLRQRLSDEICRIVTEPDPFIEQRKYYTNADLIRIPVRAVFVITAIQQPFQNADLLQRAIILELDKSVDLLEGKPTVMYDSFWKARQLARFGGREAWVAHHLTVLQRFFRLVALKWNDSYSAKNRLINFEQAILLMAEVFNIPSSWIPDFLVSATDRSVSDADWVLEGIHAFALEHNRPNLRMKRFRASSICEWVETQPEYKGCEMLVNHRKLGRYLRSHKSAIQNLTGIVEAGVDNNRICYRFEGRTLERR